jgi:hypothetical protein
MSPGRRRWQAGLTRADEVPAQRTPDLFLLPRPGDGVSGEILRAAQFCGFLGEVTDGADVAVPPPGVELDVRGGHSVEPPCVCRTRGLANERAAT